MPPVLEQSAYNTVGKEDSRRCTATFTRPTKPGSLIVVMMAAAGTLPSDVHMEFPSGFTKIGERGARDIQSAIWYRGNCPSISSVQIHSDDADKSMQLRVFEYSGMAQANVLDRVNIEQSDSDSPHSGSSGTIAQADELVLAFIVNQYASTAQYGWSGGFTRLYENTSPQKYDGDETDSDWERSRMSVHQIIPNTVGSFNLKGRLSTERRWQGYIVTFRGGTTGPARMSSTQAVDPMLTTEGGSGSLTVFGPLRSGIEVEHPPMISTEGAGAGGRIGPFNYQYRLGGWNGLLIGSGTIFHVQGTEGLNGWTIRTSDEDRPRADGAYRGIDLGGARNVLFNMNVGRGRDEVERNMDALYRALVPQRDTDWELIWRHPTHGLKMMRVRPGDLIRERNSRQLTIASQNFVLRAADPRHYNAIPTKLVIPVTPANQIDNPIKTRVFNIGNSPAYPVITIDGPSNDIPVTKIQLVNDTALVNFELQLILQKGSTVVADMDARITGAPRSIITLDGQSKYGAWQLPREPFRIDPDPTGFGGYNELYLRTVPEGAPVRCTLEYRDTWHG